MQTDLELALGLIHDEMAAYIKNDYKMNGDYECEPETYKIICMEALLRLENAIVDNIVQIRNRKAIESKPKE